MTTVAAAPRPIEYPTRDGRPMAETDKHAELMFYFRGALKTYFAGRTDVYVAGNNFVFWEEGNPKARISPDAYVVFGSTPDLRDSFMAWKEGGRLPAVIFEFTSRKTRREDTDLKRPLYERTLRTPEYFQFDPTGDYLKPRLQGQRLVSGQYVPLELVQDRLHSEQLGLDLVQQGELLRLYDPRRAEFLPTTFELSQLVTAEAERAEMEARRAAEAETEVQRLRAEIARLRAGGSA